MFSHVSLGSKDIGRSIAFYDAAMATIGYGRCSQGKGWAAYGEYGDVGVGVLWILTPINGLPATAGNGVNVGLLARTRAAVDSFYKAALERGGMSDGPPGIRAADHPNFYAAYVFDPDGNKLVVVCHVAS
jgi:catechol 2,3-dioxygenase-like lactoylglutathione lyase family enzyme